MKPVQWQRLSVWLRLGRVSNLPTVWTNALAGCWLAGASPDAWWTALLCLVLSLYYVGGMYLNDAFDREVDSRERPERPIPAGVVSAISVFAAGFGLLALGAVATGWLAAEQPRASAGLALVSGGALAALIVFYDAYHKQNPLSPLVMGLCRVLVYITAALSVEAEVGAPVLWGALALLSHLIGLTFAAKQENLAALKSIWPLACLALPALYGAWLGLAEPWVWPFLALYTGWVVYALQKLFPGAQRSIPGAVVRLIAGIALLDAMLLAALGSWHLALVAVGFAALTRLLQSVVPGT